MSIKTSLYYFPNDLLKQKGIVITLKDLEEISKKYGTKITAKPDKIGSIGPISHILLRGLLIDIIVITIEGDNEESIKATIKELYSKYGEYEVFSGKISSIAKKLKSELKQN